MLRQHGGGILCQHGVRQLAGVKLLQQRVLRLIDEDVPPIRFASYPHEDAWVLGLRERINREIEKRI